MQAAKMDHSCTHFVEFAGCQLKMLSTENLFDQDIKDGYQSSISATVHGHL